MGRKPIDPNPNHYAKPTTLLLLTLASCTLAYTIVSLFFRFGTVPFGERRNGLVLDEGNVECCGGIKGLELWGPVAKWGSEFRVNGSVECCRKCKEMCGQGGKCLCDSWVFCGDKETCGKKFGECWLKKQKDSLVPERPGFGSRIVWTSGMIFGKGEGIVGLDTDHGTIRIELYPDCAPHSVAYILELLALRHCAGCHFYRAEGRGSSWDTNGNHIQDASFGPPFALIQGTLEAHGTLFKHIPAEVCPAVKRGAVAWVGSGPEFFISLANHQEWNKAYTVFGSVLDEDMEIVEKMIQLPTRPEIWKNINVSVLEDPVTLWIRRLETSHEGLV
ncbi:Peptidyl-prolyl cis-trans isomerase-like 3-like protein [Drosera capensis]